ncbi:MAG: cytochrome c oxidase subunit 4 [Actinomycetes bacterium]
MKQESWLLLLLGLFFGIMGVVYWTWGHEDGGGVMLLGAFLLGMLPGFYYLWWSRKTGGNRPEDRSDATVADGAGVVSSFPSTSIWPFVLGMSCFIMVLALVFGNWLAVIGVPLLAAALIGATAESRRGGDV